MRISPPTEDDEADIEILEDMGDTQKIWKNAHVDYYIGKRAILCSYKNYIHTYIWVGCVCVCVFGGGGGTDPNFTPL